MSAGSSGRGRDKCTYLVKDILQLVLREGAALDVLDRTKLLGHPLAILLPHGLHFLFRQLLTHAGIIPQIDLGADDEAGHARAVVVYFGEPFLAHVFEGSRGCDTEADQEDVGLRI